MQLTAEMVEAMSGLYLSPRYDNASITPEFHREVWRLYCNPEVERAAIAAPRKHSKTTAFTHDFVLATVLFRWQEFVLLLGSTEALATINLRNIAYELSVNEDLKRDFAVKSFIVDQQTDLIVECLDGYQFRIMARGAGQAIRGLMWHGKRPGLINVDDIEDDELVSNRDRRAEFKSWFYEAVMPALRLGGVIRVHGTVMHDDSLLSHLLKDPSWEHRTYRAHQSYSEFTDILWPERFTEAFWRREQRTYETAGRSDSYSKEYLNDPRDTSEAYLKVEQFLPMQDEDRQSWKLYAVGVDFAISKESHANRTSLTVGGKDLENLIHVVDERVGRWDAFEIVEEMFSVFDAWHPSHFFVEGGAIWKALEPLINAEMSRRDKWLPIEIITPIRDKASRGRPFQARMKARSMRFDKKASWYPGYEDELLHFTGYSEALLDDQFDSTALLVRGLEPYRVESGDERTDDEMDWLTQSVALMRDTAGRSDVTGY